MSEAESIRVLLVDADPAVLRAYGAMLRRDGAVVETQTSSKQAAERVRATCFDIVLCDVAMPEMTGIEFLKAVRAHDLELPVGLMTGNPSVESATNAIEYGACFYLSKPVPSDVLREKVNRAVRLRKPAMADAEAPARPGAEHVGISERAALEVRFSWGLSLMWMAFQPIVAWRERRVFGYEALLRSDEPMMKNPAQMLEAAQQLGRTRDLGRAVRRCVATAALDAPAGTLLFVNLHASDLEDDDLHSPNAPLSAVAERVILEVTERASLSESEDPRRAVASLKALGYRVAVDDLGAGYAGLSSFTRLEPQVVKLDMSLVRGVDADHRRQNIVRSMKSLCDDLAILVVAEGVETAAERDALAELGVDLLQGYLFARPERGFRTPRW